MIKPMPYQRDISDLAIGAWECEALRVKIVLPPGEGKYVTMAHVISRVHGYRIVITPAHALLQMSVALAALNVRHDVQAGPNILRGIWLAHNEKHGLTFHVPGAECILGTLCSIRQRLDELAPSIKKAELVAIDGSEDLDTQEWWDELEGVIPAGCRRLNVEATPLSGRTGSDFYLDYSHLAYGGEY